MTVVKRANPKTLLVMLVLLLGIHCATAAGRPIYVDANAPPGGDGSSWATALKYLQDALADANSDPDPNDIWVAAGVYTPDTNSAEPNGTGDQTATFQLINGVAIYGGFPGGGGIWEDRDPNLYETILSGDLYGDDDLVIEPGTGGGIPGENCAEAGPIYRGGTVFSNTGSTTDGPGDCITYQDIWYVYTAEYTGCSRIRVVQSGGGGYYTAFSVYEGGTCPPTVLLACEEHDSLFNVAEDADYLIRVGGYYPNSTGMGIGTITLTWDVLGDNSYHVVTGFGTDANAILDGLTITRGNSGSRNGGGMYNDNSNPTITNCTFIGNKGRDGGGMYNNNSNPTITNCTFSGNSAVGNDGGGIFGGGTITNCTFSENSASSWGGGIRGGATVTNCMFIGNSAGGDGGGIFFGGTITNCTFIGNSAYGRGGGMHKYLHGGTVTNCTFIGNSAYYGGGMGIYLSQTVSPTVTNCAFIDNSAGKDGGGMHNERSSPTVTNCTFIGNSANQGGGGTYNDDCTPRLTNCTFSGNSAGKDYGGGIFGYNSSEATLTNCILWGNEAGGWLVELNQIYHDSYSSTLIYYTCVEGWTGALGGGGNIGDDPLFVDADGPDDTVGTEDDNLRLSADSACIDAGASAALPEDTPDLDNDGNTAERMPLDLDYGERFLDDPCTVDTGVPDPPAHPNVVDMGAYEYHYGTGTCWDTAVCAGQPNGDATCDGNVNLADLFALKAHFGKSAPWTPPECCADFTQDGFINLAELFVLKTGFGTSGHSPSTLNQNCPP